MKQNSEQKVEDMNVSPTCGKPLVMGSTGNLREIEGINRVHHLNFLNNTLPDKCASLIIADPPYFEVKGAFDFIWEDMKAYLQDVEKWAKECKRLMADNGTLFWYGHAKNIAYSQVILDEYFELINNLVWEKTDCQTKKSIEYFRMFAPITERILMYSSAVDNLDEIMHNPENFKSIKQYLKEEKKKLMQHFGFSAKQFNDYTLQLGCSTTPYKNWFCNTGFWEMATKEMYEKLQVSRFFQKDFEELFTEFSYLREQYEIRRRPFQNSKKLTDVLRFSQQANITGNYDHDTCKPEILTRALIMTCSRPNDLVIVPFAGSGTEVAMAIKEGRRAIGFEITEKHVIMSNKRVSEILRKPELFR